MMRKVLIVLVCFLFLMVLGGSVYGQEACIEPPSGLVSWWPGAGNANDIVGTNDGTMMNGATFAAGKVGDTFSLDGVNDYIDISTPSGLARGSTEDRSFFAWIKPESLPPHRTWILDQRSSPCSGFIVRFGVNNGKLELLTNDLCVGGYAFSGPTSLTPGEWAFVGYTYKGSTREVKVYLNGALENSGISTQGGGLAPNNFRIGADATNIQDSFFHGMIDEVQFFDRDLTPAEILAEYNAGSAGKCGGIPSTTTPPPTTTPAPTTTAPPTTTPAPTTTAPPTTTPAPTTTTLPPITTPPPPDRDGDGVIDSRDTCPSKPGPSCNNGCPRIDSDGDGMQESTSNCPNYDEYPNDRDNDGLSSSVDCDDNNAANTKKIPNCTDIELKGSIKITSDPTGADILLDGVPVGQTPFSLTDLTIGVDHKITISMADYFKMEKIVSATTEGSTVHVGLNQMTADQPKAHITFSQKSTFSILEVGEETMIETGLINDGNADAYDVMVLMEIPSGVSASFVTGGSTAGGLVIWSKDVLKKTATASIKIRVKMLEEGRKLVPLRITYKEENGDINTGDALIEITAVSKTKTEEKPTSVTTSESMGEKTELERKNREAELELEKMRMEVEKERLELERQRLENEKGGVCGPTLILLLALIPLALIMPKSPGEIS